MSGAAGAAATRILRCRGADLTCVRRFSLGSPRRAGFLHELFQRLVGLRADDAVARGDKGRNPGHAVAVRLRPIGVDRVLEAALVEDGARLVRRQSDRGGDFDQQIDIGEVLRVDEICLVQPVVDRFSARLRLGPFAELLRKPAVIGWVRLRRAAPRRPSAFSSADTTLPGRCRARRRIPPSTAPRGGVSGCSGKCTRTVSIHTCLEFLDTHGD